MLITYCMMYLVFIYAHICRWNCLSMFCILCSLQFEMESISQAQILQWQEDALYNPYIKELLWGKNRHGNDIICLFCEICFCLLRQKNHVAMITLEFKPNFWPRFMFLSCLCSDWLLSSLPGKYSRCSYCTYFKKEETNASEHISISLLLFNTHW